MVQWEECSSHSGMLPPPSRHPPQLLSFCFLVSNPWGRLSSILRLPSCCYNTTMFFACYCALRSDKQVRDFSGVCACSCDDGMWRSCMWFHVLCNLRQTCVSVVQLHRWCLICSVFIFHVSFPVVVDFLKLQDCVRTELVQYLVFNPLSKPPC